MVDPAWLNPLLRASAKPLRCASVTAWWELHREIAGRSELPIDAAIQGGFAADRLAYAFGAGYQAAIAALFPAHARLQLGAFCASEAGGAHPRTIVTRLQAEGRHYRLSGSKSYVSFGSMAEVLYVVASEGYAADGHNRLRVVALKRREGVQLSEGKPLSFAVEVPHASLELNEVLVAEAEILSGDGYLEYLKPFRTIEDIHVSAAIVGWLLQVARRSEWPSHVCERLIALLVLFRSLAVAEPLSPAVHLALGGALEMMQRLNDELRPLWEMAEAGAHASWQRDRVLLKVAAKARARRLDSAWQRIAGEPLKMPSTLG